MELDKKRFSIRRHITLVLTLLTVLIVLLIGVCVAVVREQSRTRLTSAADSYLSLLTRTLENQLVIQESYITSQVLNSEELHRLGFGEGHTQAYLDSYKLQTGFSSAMAAGNDVTALYLYSEPNSILMSEYATAQAGRPTETQIQKTNLEETLRSMVDAKTLNDERWTPYVVSGQQYWVRAVHYYGAWLISVVNLDRQCSQATDGMLAFAQPDGVLLAGTRPEEGELSHYISLTAETEGLVLEYYVPSTDMDLDNAMNLALAVGITAVLAAICFVIWYLRSNVVHPLDALVDAMRRISAGDLSVRADWNPVNLELQQVKEAFNVMLKEIETLKIEQYEQKLDAERQEMAALKMQIRPHFFLNNLKLIYALAETGQTQQIQRMILLLSKHLRYVMDYKRETTSLRDETNFCQNYMEMTGIGQKFPPFCRVTVSLDLQEKQLLAVALNNIAAETFAVHSELSPIASVDEHSYAMLLQNTAGEEMDLEGIMRQLMYISNVAQQYLRCSMAFYLDDKLPVPKMPDLWEKLLHMQGENVTLRSGVFRLKEAPRQPHIFRVPQIRTWNTLLKDGYPEAVKQEAMTLLDEMSARGEMNADSLRSFYQDFMQMIYFTVGGSEEKIHELFYQPEALELYRNGMKSVDEMKALIRYVTSSWTEHKSVDESKELLDKLKQYIDEHLESELRRDELAEYVHLNPDYLTRLMKKQTGYSLKEYVTRRKMETARTLLRTTTLPVGFIAAKLGYNNFSHFSYTYKKIMDVTPQEERHTEEK